MRYIRITLRLCSINVFGQTETAGEEIIELFKRFIFHQSLTIEDCCQAANEVKRNKKSIKKGKQRVL